jgi:hypothetical protein
MRWTLLSYLQSWLYLCLDGLFPFFLSMQEGGCRSVWNRQINHDMSTYSKFFFLDRVVAIIVAIVVVEY